MASIITEEMANEYAKCSLYAEFIKQLQTSERNAQDEFMQSLGCCSSIYVPKPWEIVKDFRKKAADQGLDAAWIDKFMPAQPEEEVPQCPLTDE